uniref:trypsin n=1 Tax=Scophthalmus maximus TaxID=52904 RepID=A0A8D2ZKU8_SCOMX
NDDDTNVVHFIFEEIPFGIVGGKVSKPHSRPYMASLQFQGQHSCGGILIRKDFVLTAAHCKNGREDMTVVLGAHNLSKEENSQQHLQVAAYHPHPNYDGKQEYDIMLLKLKHNAKLNKYVKPIGLPKKDGKTPANVNCVVAGWGRTGAQEIASDVLRETTEKVQANAVFPQTNQSCLSVDFFLQGDSGGPLICNSKPQGITAFTCENECNNPKYPHVFTKLHFFLPWIKKILQE